jgi:hypothetical protein
MSRVSVTTQLIPYAGLLPVMTAPTVANDVVDGGRTALHVINGGGASITVTVVTPGVVDGDLPITDRVVTVPVGTTPTIIPLSSPNYRQTAASVDVTVPVNADVGRCYVNYSAVASVTRAVTGAAN